MTAIQFLAILTLVAGVAAATIVVTWRHGIRERKLQRRAHVNLMRFTGARR